MLPGSFVFDVVTPLYLAHLDDFTVGYSLYRIQNSDWSLLVWPLVCGWYAELKLSSVSIDS
jgi:hypothetical protein